MSITLSPKQLGVLADPGFCARCFWIHHRMKFKAPYSMFPGIFSTLDKYQKNIVAESVKRNGSLPQWLIQGFGLPSTGVVVEPAPHWSKFSIDIHGLTFRGAADTLLRLPDGSLFILDEKTAKPKALDNKLECMYDVQLNGYARIANELGMGPVSGLGIVYNVPQQLTDEDDIEMLVGPDSYSMSFRPEVRVVVQSPPLVDTLLAQASGIIALEDCPVSYPGCKNCEKIDDMAALA